MLTIFKRGVESLRQPDRQPRCYDMTEQERLEKIRGWNNRNVWNTPDLTNQDQLAEQLSKDGYYGA